MLYRWAFSLLTLVVLLSVVSAAIAQEKLRLAWAGFSPTNSPIWVMEDRKLLQKQGVTPEIIAINASPTVLQALLANEIEAASISVTTLTSSRLAGADTVMIFGSCRRLSIISYPCRASPQWSSSREKPPASIDWGALRTSVCASP
jgi:hypothetical protein